MATGPSAGGSWPVAGAVAGGRLAGGQDLISTGRLARLGLAWADAHGVGLIARAGTPSLAAAYRRFGFVPVAEQTDSLLLCRHPAGRR